MKLSVFLVPAMAGLAITAAQARGGITIQVIPALAPNAYGSSNWGEWQSNAITAITNGYVSFGTANTPGLYEALHTQNIYANQICVTSHNSWMGQLDPGTAFGPQYASEYGNRLHFGIHIMGNGTQFSISELGFSASSTDPDNALGFDFPVGSYGYSAGYVGISYGPDRVKGTTDDFHVTGGPNTQLVDELVGRGSGNAYWPDYGLTNPTQADIDAQIALIPNSFFTGTYTLVDGLGHTLATGFAKVHIKPTH